MRRAALLLGTLLLATAADAQDLADLARQTPALHRTAADLVQALEGAAIAAERDWPARFVGALRRPDGTPVAADEVLGPAREARRLAGELQAELARLQGELDRGEADALAFVEHLDPLVEQAVVAAWDLALEEADRAVELIRGQYGEAVAEARRRHPGPAEAQAYVEAEARAARRARQGFVDATQRLLAARDRAEAALDGWREAAERVGREVAAAGFSAVIDDRLNMAAKAGGTVKSALERFLEAREVLLDGGPADAPPPRLQMAEAFDAVAAAQSGEASPGGEPPYFFRHVRPPRFVAGVESLAAPIWPPHRHPWARGLPADVAVDIERGARLLLFHGRGFLPDGGGPVDVRSEDPKVTYTVLAAARGRRDPDEMLPALWEGWMSAPWRLLSLPLEPSDPSQAWLEALESMDRLMVLARAAPGSLPGQKNLRIGGLPAFWVLPVGTTRADVRFVREIGPGTYEPLVHAFHGDVVRVLVEVDAEVAIEALPIKLGGVLGVNPTTRALDRLNRRLQARREPGNPRRYVTSPLTLIPLERARDLLPRGVVPIDEYVRLLAGIDTEAVVLRSPAEVRVAKEPGGIGAWRSWRAYVEKVAGLRNRTVPPNLAAFLRDTSEELTTAFRFRLTKIGTTEVVWETVKVRLGDHAALLMLRDEFVSALDAVEREWSDLQAALQAGQGPDDTLRALAFMRLLDEELQVPWSPWRRVEVTGPSWPERRRVERKPEAAPVRLPRTRPAYGDHPHPLERFLARLGAQASDLVTETRMELAGKVPLAWALEGEYLARFPWSERDRWRLDAVREALAWYLGMVRQALAEARAIKPGEIEKLLKLVEVGFEPIVDRVMPYLVEGPGPWVPDRVARNYVNTVHQVAAQLAAGHEEVALQRGVALVALTAATFLTAPEALAFRVLSAAEAAVGAGALALLTIPEFLNRRSELDFAWGASPVLGADRLAMAELQAMPPWQLFFEGVMVALGVRADFRSLVQDLRVGAAAARSSALLTQIQQGGSRQFYRMSVDNQADVAALIGDATSAERALGKSSLSRTQRQALDVRDLLEDDLAGLLARSRNYPPGWHLARTGGAIVSQATTVPPPGYPPALVTKGTPGVVVRALDAAGQPVTYRTGNLLGEGVNNYVYAVADDPAVVLKFPKRDVGGRSAWVRQAARTSDLLLQRGIRHMPVVAVAPDAPTPFYAQARLPRGVARFEDAERGIVGYRVTRPGTVVPDNPSDDDLRLLAARGDVELEVGFGLAGGGTLSRPHQRALFRLFKRLGAAGIAAEDLHIANVYFERVGLRWEAGIVDLDYIGPWARLEDFAEDLDFRVRAVEGFPDDRDRRPVSLRGPTLSDVERQADRRRAAGAERLYPDADFFAEKTLERKWYVTYLREERRWVSNIVDVELMEEYYPNFRRHVDVDFEALAAERANGIPGPTVPPDTGVAGPARWAHMPPPGTGPPGGSSGGTAAGPPGPGGLGGPPAAPGAGESGGRPGRWDAPTEPASRRQAERAARMTDTTPAGAPPGDRLPDPEEFDPTKPLPSVNERILEKWQRGTVERNRRWEAEQREKQADLQRRWAEAGRFDVSRVPPGGRTRQGNPLDGDAPVRKLIPGDTEYLVAIMRDAGFRPGQHYVYAHLVNAYADAILGGEPFPRGVKPIQVSQDGVIHEGHHRYVAACIVHRLTGRPLLDGPNAIIPPDAIDLKYQPQAGRQPTSLRWRLQVRPPEPAPR
jgi:hypothetical protein